LTFTRGARRNAQMSASNKSERIHLLKEADDIEIEINALKIAKRVLSDQYETNLNMGRPAHHWGNAIDCVDSLLHNRRKELDSVTSDLRNLLWKDE
jgi:hypothetical protein